MSTTNSSRTSGTPAYKADGVRIARLVTDDLVSGATYEPYAKIVGRGADGPAVAEACADLLDRAVLAETRRRWTESASCCALVFGADGFRYADGSRP